MSPEPKNSLSVQKSPERDNVLQPTLISYIIPTHSSTLKQMFIQGFEDGVVGKGLLCKHKDLSSNPQNPHKTRYSRMYP